MSILIDKDTRLLLQGAGRAGLFHAEKCREYEQTKLVGAVHPGTGATVAARTADALHVCMKPSGRRSMPSRLRTHKASSAMPATPVQTNARCALRSILFIL